MTGILHDLRYAFRTLGRNPGVVAVALLLLAIGIGANATIFGFVNAFFLKPLPVKDADRLVRIYARSPSGSLEAGFSRPEYERFRDSNRTLANVAATTLYAQMHLVAGENTREVRTEFVTSNYFSIFAVHPELGRFFAVKEDEPGGAPVAVISHSLWQTSFQSKPETIGRSITVNGAQALIVGVMPTDFYGDVPGDRPDVWMPSTMLSAVGRGCESNSPECALINEMIGSRREGVSLEQVQAEAEARILWSSTDYPNRKRTPLVYRATGAEPMQQAELKPQMRLLMAVTATLLLIACANLAGLFIVRGIGRNKEIAVRLAIGASRGRIIRQLLLESVLISAAGSVAGVGISRWGSALLARYYTMSSEGFQIGYDLAIDAKVIGYTCAVGLVTAAAFGLAPALQTLRRNLTRDLKFGPGSVGTQRSGRLRQLLVSAQIALTLILLVGSGLLVHSVRSLARGSNFNPQNAYIIRIRPEMLKYGPDRNVATVSAVVERLRALPGVEAAGFMQGGEGLVWQWSNGRNVDVSLPGATNTVPVTVLRQEVSGGFFDALQIPIRAGRPLLDTDSASAPHVVVVNEPLARKFWPDSSALGQVLLLNGTQYRVVGIAASTMPEGPAATQGYKVFPSFWQWNPAWAGDYRIVVRMSGDAADVQRAIHKAVQSVDPAVPMGEEVTVSQQVASSYSPVLLARSVVSYCGLLALCMSALGLYTLLAYAVRSRTREIGVRMALGGQPSDIVRLIVRQGIAMAASGIAIGAVGAIWTLRLMANFFYGTRSYDGVVYLSAAVVLMVVSAMAAGIPANRASRVDPMVALRDE